ncbi:glycosyltransferase family 2 protein [Parapedobacter koreensis]|uniref:Glycosyl transferase family 2 n=1 Tax=Parapedobacter koreensis TaxID=332977 RepID=A0A1H7IGV1_9SPHI|nr:glycosyltransferase [Parapedobacter koreensis]SEK61773.1 Glycosyl transferase family 2 [Parapedobacter koreensis]
MDYNILRHTKDIAMLVHHFDEVTLLITHYNRSQSLERLLSAFVALNCSFQEIVVSDDGSSSDHLSYINKLRATYNFSLITTASNKGLGNNINKGQDAVKTAYTLYIQEDFIPKPAFIASFKDALQIMHDEEQWDLVTFYSYIPYPYLVPYKMGFSEKKFRPQPWYTNLLKFYVYGDHPHLRRSSFLEKFGRYQEGGNGDNAEMSMALSFIKHNGRALLYDQLNALLEQKNTTVEPSTADFRKDWKQSQTPAILLLRRAYLCFKFIKLNIQLITLRK